MKAVPSLIALRVRFLYLPPNRAKMKDCKKCIKNNTKECLTCIDWNKFEAQLNPILSAIMFACGLGGLVTYIIWII